MGRTLIIGDTVELRITGHTDPCERMDDDGHPGLRKALEDDYYWRAGVTCEVITGGHVHLGSSVAFVDEADRKAA